MINDDFVSDFMVKLVGIAVVVMILAAAIVATKRISEGWYDRHERYSADNHVSHGRFYNCSHKTGNMPCIGHLIESDTMTRIEAVAMLTFHFPYKENDRIQPWVRDAIKAVGREEEARRLFHERAMTSEWMNNLVMKLQVEGPNGE